MSDRIGYFFLGVVFFLYLIIFAVNKNIKIGEKYIKFDDAGSLWILPAIVFLIAGIYGFYFAFRSEKSIKRYPEYMWCADCAKFYMYEDVKNTDQICPDCGKKLTEYNDGDYWKRNASDQSTKSPKSKKRKFKKR